MSIVDGFCLPASLTVCQPELDGYGLGDTDIFGRILIKHFGTQNARSRRNSIQAHGATTTTHTHTHTRRSNSNKRQQLKQQRKTAIIIINELQAVDRQEQRATDSKRASEREKLIKFILKTQNANLANTR